MQVISEYFGDDNKLTAVVGIDNNIPYVDFINNGLLVERRKFPNNTLDYAEEAGENFVTGILKLDKRELL